MTTVADRIIQVCLVVVGVIHLLPSVGAAGGAHLGSLYGISIDGPELTILMRHRAVLFGILGILFVAGAIRGSLRAAALLAGVVSVASFLLLAMSASGYNAQVGRVVVVDWVALFLLVVAGSLQLWRHTSVR